MGTTYEQSPQTELLPGSSPDAPRRYPMGQLRTFHDYFRLAWMQEEAHYFTYANNIWHIDPEHQTLELTRLSSNPDLGDFTAASLVLYAVCDKLKLSVKISPEVLTQAQDLERSARLMR